MRPGRTKRIVALVCACLAVAALAYWGITSRRSFTQTEIMEEVVVKDEIFGTTTTKQVWKPGFILGLEYTAAFAGPLLLIAAGFFWSARRDERRAGMGT